MIRAIDIHDILSEIILKILFVLCCLPVVIVFEIYLYPNMSTKFDFALVVMWYSKHKYDCKYFDFCNHY